MPLAKSATHLPPQPRPELLSKEAHTSKDLESKVLITGETDGQALLSRQNVEAELEREQVP